MPFKARPSREWIRNTNSRPRLDFCHPTKYYVWRALAFASLPRTVRLYGNFIELFSGIEYTWIFQDIEDSAWFDEINLQPLLRTTLPWGTLNSRSARGYRVPTICAENGRGYPNAQPFPKSDHLECRTERDVSLDFRISVVHELQRDAGALGSSG